MKPAKKKPKGRIFKIVLLGDGSVGKTSLRERFLGRGFDSSYLMTVGADFAIYDANINGENVKLQIWDLAGQHRFRDVRLGFYAGTAGAVMVFDVTRKDTASNLVDWYKELKKSSKNKDLFLMVVANKIDLRKSVSSSIDEKEGRAVARTLMDLADSGVPVDYVETSAKDNINVPQAFLKLAENILNNVNMKR